MVTDQIIIWPEKMKKIMSRLFHWQKLSGPLCLWQFLFFFEIVLVKNEMQQNASMIDAFAELFLEEIISLIPCTGPDLWQQLFHLSEYKSQNVTPKYEHEYQMSEWMHY